MNIQGICAGQNCPQQTNFKASYVTLSQKNLGEKIAKNVVEKFNRNILPEIKTSSQKEAEEVIKKTAGK